MNNLKCCETTFTVYDSRIQGFFKHYLIWVLEIRLENFLIWDSEKLIHIFEQLYRLGSYEKLYGLRVGIQLY